jgi:mRNA deadenylase 3'-5' endonuclease subunit Ccr4
VNKSTKKVKQEEERESRRIEGRNYQSKFVAIDDSKIFVEHLLNVFQLFEHDCLITTTTTTNKQTNKQTNKEDTIKIGSILISCQWDQFTIFQSKQTSKYLPLPSRPITFMP